MAKYKVTFSGFCYVEADSEDEAKEKADAEAKAKAEADRLANPTQEDLLKEIRDLLKAKSEKPAKKESK
mgnify:CR=1 FL=1